MFVWFPRCFKETKEQILRWSKYGEGRDTPVLTRVIFAIPAVQGVGTAVGSVQAAAEQGLSAAMMKMQVCLGCSK